MNLHKPYHANSAPTIDRISVESSSHTKLIKNPNLAIRQDAFQEIPVAGSAAAYPFDTTSTLMDLVRDYEESGEPISLSFRELVHWMKVGERATHYLHPYPAKLLPQIAHFFLAARGLTPSTEIVLDPFAGTGTVALETSLSGRQAYYCDANPLARLITIAKTKTVDLQSLDETYARIKEIYHRNRRAKRPPVVNIDLWYEKTVSLALARLRAAILSESNSQNLEFFLVTFSAVARRSSRADPRFSVPVQKNPRYINLNEIKPKTRSAVLVWQFFTDQFCSNRKRHQNLSYLGNNFSSPICVGENAKQLTLAPPHAPEAGISKLPDACVGLIITSPPYAGAQKYIRASSLSLGWLGLVAPPDLRAAEERMIGREHFAKSVCNSLVTTGLPEADKIISLVHEKNRTRATIIAYYINEMRDSLKEMARVLKPGGHLVLVVGNNEVCGMAFESSSYLTSIAKEAGLNPRLKLIDEIKSRGLMTKRNKTASVITREWVLLFEKKV